MNRDAVTSKVLASEPLARREVYSELEYRVEFENLITAISTRFINLAREEIDAGISDALRRIGEFSGVDRSYVLLYTLGGSRISTTHEWCAPGIPPGIDVVQGVSVSTWPWFMERLAVRQEVVHLPSIDEMPPEADAERTAMKEQDIKSMILVPMVYQNQSLGFLGFDSVRSYKTWSEESVVLLKIVGEIFVNALERKWAEEELQAAHRELERRVEERTAELREANLQLLLEVAERRRVEEELKYRVAFENLITTISTSFISLAPSEIDDGIRHALWQIGEFAGVDRSYVLMFYNDGRSVDTTHEWCAEGISPAIDRVHTSPVSKIPWVNSRIKQLQVVHIPRLSVIPPEADDEKKEFESQGIKSIILVPMVYRGKAVGMLGFDAVRSQKEWSDEAITLLKIVGEMFVNVLERKRVEDALRESQRTLEQRVAERTREIGRRREVAEGLRDILAVLNSSRPLNEILDYILSEACRLLGTSVGAVYQLDDGRELLTAKAVKGLQDTDVDTVVALGQGVVNQSLIHRISIAGCDIALSRCDRSLPLPAQPTEECSTLQPISGWRTVLAIPVVTKEDVYGCIVLYYHDDQMLSSEALELANTLGDHAALAIENDRLRRQAERMAIESERSRLARELHDAVTQTLFSASIMAEVLPRVWEDDIGEGRNCLEELRLLTRGALAEMRTLLLELRPAALVEADLSELLRQLAEATHNRTRVPIVVNVEGRRTLPADVQIALYRIAQEALNNAAKHAAARNVSVSLVCLEDEIKLTIKDDGRGFDTSSQTQGRLGFGIMSERASAIGGKVTISSQVGKGTSVSVTWPVKEEQSRHAVS